MNQMLVLLASKQIYIQNKSSGSGYLEKFKIVYKLTILINQVETIESKHIWEHLGQSQSKYLIIKKQMSFQTNKYLKKKSPNQNYLIQESS